MLAWRRGGKRAWAMLGAVGVVGVGLALFGRYAAACYWSQFDSIHFHSGHPDYGLPPRRAILEWRGEFDDRPQAVIRKDGYTDNGEWEGTPATGEELTDRKEELRQAELDRKRRVMLKAVNADIAGGRWHHARQLLAAYCNRVGWRGELRDRDQVLQQLETAAREPAPTLLVKLEASQLSSTGSPTPDLLRHYLDGLSAVEGDKTTEARTAFEQVAAGPHAGFLRDHARYQLACLEHDTTAVDLFSQLLRESPHTIKREDALVMLARKALLTGVSENRRVQEGRAALAQLKREYPHTRFHRDLVGLQGRLDYLQGRWTQAAELYLANDDLPSVEQTLRQMSPQQQGPIRIRLMAAYLQRLTATQSYNTFSQALQQIDHIRHSMTPAEAVQFGNLLVERPEVASGYLYYRLYHLTLEPGEQRSLACLADRIVDRHPAMRLSVPVQVRLAEVYYRDGQYHRALFWANRALQTGFSDRALYVRAATEQKLGRRALAQADFERVRHLFPNSPLRQAVLENLTLYYERQHRFGEALDIYFAIDYKPDLAYLLDVRMTPEQIADYLRRHAHSSQRNLVAYSLGIRYLRQERWAEARRLLTSIPHAIYLKYAQPVDKDGYGYKTDPLRVLTDLERLHKNVIAARTDRERASALYWYAHYYATGDELLLYNLALWNGEREIDFQERWTESVATHEDREAVYAHMFAHEHYARSRRICLDLIRRYPDTPTVPYALYRAAVDDMHLARFNVWWEEKQHYDFLKEMHRLKKRLTRDYPRHPVTHKMLAHMRTHPEQPAQLWRPQRSAGRASVTEGLARD
jgi:tetratricopeptide (TPR) repeat protein